MAPLTPDGIDMQTIDDAILLALGDDILNNGPPATHREKRFLSALSSSLVAFMTENPTMDIKQAIRHFEKNNPHFPPVDGRCAINELLPDEVLAMIFECGVEQECIENWEYAVEEEDGIGCGDDDCGCGEEHDDDDEDEEEEEEEGWKKAKRTKRPVLVKPPTGRPGQATVEDASESDSTDSEDGRPGPSKPKRPLVISKDEEIQDDDGDEDYEDVDDDDDEEDQNEQRLLPFPVLTSHVCKRWRDISLRNPKLWSTITFNKHLKTELAQLYIERSQSLPLTIRIDCMIPEAMDEEDHPDHPLFKENMSRIWDKTQDRHNATLIDGPEGTATMVPRNNPPSLKKPFLSTTDLTEILDLITPVVNRWKVFDFQATTYGSVHAVMTRLARLTSAPLLENLELYHFEECDDFEQFSGDDKTAYLPFGGDAPALESCVLWGVHIDWDGALPFLKRVKTLEISYHAKDVRPSYPTFVEMIQGNPDLKKLDLSLSGPALATESLQGFDAPIEEGGWGTTPVEFPSLETLVLQYHECQYATALISHFRFPNVRELEIDFIEEDFSDLARSLASPLSSTSTILPISSTARRAGSSSFDTPSILSQLTTIKIGALPANLTALEAFLGELTKAKVFKIKLGSTAEEIMLQKLGDPQFGRRPKREKAAGDKSKNKNKDGEAEEDEEDEDLLAIARDLGALPEALVDRPDIPMLYLPAMEELVVCNAEASAMKSMLVKRTALGAPRLKKIMFSDGSRVALDEKDSYLKEYADEVTYFCPSDSEDDEDEEDWEDEDEDEEEYDDEDGEEDEEGDEEGEGQDEEFLEEEESPLFAILGRPRRVRGREGEDDDN